MSTYLLELGTEELPANFADSVVLQLHSLIKFELDKNFIKFKKIYCSSTPRRIILLISGIVDIGEDKVELRKGPFEKTAFLDGVPTKAAIGFAKSLNINVNDLQIKKTDKGTFVFGEKIEKGKSSKDLISVIIPKTIRSIQGQRFMKWGYGNFRFSRPIRWIISLYNDEIVNFSTENIDKDLLIGNVTRGHRLKTNKIEIKHSDEYLKCLLDSGIIVQREIRKEEITKLVMDASSNLKLYPDLPEKLLKELTDLVESPDLIVGCFDSEFLSLPFEVLCTVMKNHQRYIPLFKSNRKINKLELNSYNVLSTNFFCISNGLKESNYLIKKGNENVIRARFADAKFFIESDNRITCEQRNQKIKEISYIEGLGDISERVNRIEYIASQIFKKIDDPSLLLSDLRLAAKFSKHDLCSEIVGEFPELQGLMGGKYLKKEGFSDNVALAVSEHYLPRFFKDELPSTKYGAILSIADKLETIISIFVIGKRPSGSSDPYALRRNLNGVIQLIWYFDLNLNIEQLIINCLQYWQKSLNKYRFNYENILNEIIEFVRQRIISHLDELSYDKKIIDSICNSEHIDKKRIFNILDLKKRIQIIQKLLDSKNASQIINVISRFSKLANTREFENNILSNKVLVDTKLFEMECESKLLLFIQELEKLISSEKWTYDELICLFDKNLIILENIFDKEKGVLIMSENLKIRNNRLNLLSLIRNYSLLITDFILLTF